MSQNYTPTEWVDNRTVGTASVMNNMEKGIEDAHDRIDEVDSQIKDIETVIKYSGEIQSKINNSIDKVKFINSNYELGENITLKGNIEIDGCGCSISTSDFAFIIPKDAENITFKNINFKGNLRYAKIIDLQNNGFKIKCDKNVFVIGDVLGCSNYGVTDKPFAKIIGIEDGYYILDKSINNSNSLFNDEFGAIAGTFKWSALINGLKNNNNIIIENCTFTNASGYSISLPDSNNIIIRNTSIINNGLDFINLSAESVDRFNLTIDNCNFENSIDFGKQGIIISCEEKYYKNILIKNCTFKNISESAISFGYANGLIERLTIKDCIFIDNILFGIHTGGNKIHISNNVIQGSQCAIRICDVEGVIYKNNSSCDCISITDNNIDMCNNGIVISEMLKTDGTTLIPKNLEIKSNIIYTKYVSIEVAGKIIDIYENKVFSDRDNEAPYFASSVFVNGSDNKDIVIHNNFFDGQINISWRNAFNVKVYKNIINSQGNNKYIRIRPYGNKTSNQMCSVEDNIIYKSSLILLSTNDGTDGTEFKNNTLIYDNNKSLIIPYMIGKPARYECDGDGTHWLSNTDNSWIITKDYYFKCGDKYGYISNDGTFKVTDDISNLS